MYEPKHIQTSSNITIFSIGDNTQTAFRTQTECFPERVKQRSIKYVSWKQLGLEIKPLNISIEMYN